MSLLGLHRAEIVRLERERDAALALAERRAGEIEQRDSLLLWQGKKILRLNAIETAARHLWEVQEARHDFPTWSDAYDRLGIALSAPPPDTPETEPIDWSGEAVMHNSDHPAWKMLASPGRSPMRAGENMPTYLARLYAAGVR
jgi:hypothetical protein